MSINQFIDSLTFGVGWSGVGGRVEWKVVSGVAASLLLQKKVVLESPKTNHIFPISSVQEESGLRIFVPWTGGTSSKKAKSWFHQEDQFSSSWKIIFSPIIGGLICLPRAYFFFCQVVFICFCWSSFAQKCFTSGEGDFPPVQETMLYFQKKKKKTFLSNEETFCLSQKQFLIF